MKLKPKKLKYLAQVLICNNWWEERPSQVYLTLLFGYDPSGLYDKHRKMDFLESVLAQSF